jgi:hypothetical protein
LIFAGVWKRKNHEKVAHTPQVSIKQTSLKKKEKAATVFQRGVGRNNSPTIQKYRQVQRPVEHVPCFLGKDATQSTLFITKKMYTIQFESRCGLI